MKVRHQIKSIEYITTEDVKIQLTLKKDAPYYLEVDLVGDTPIEVEVQEKEEKEEKEEFNMDCEQCPLCNRSVVCSLEDREECIYDFVHKHIKDKL